MVRSIVHIDQEKCVGCGTCVETCHEGAIGLVGGKAQLLSDEYCDGLGNCLRCPEGAISIIEREASPYDIEKAPKRVGGQADQPKDIDVPSGCPGMAVKAIQRSTPMPRQVIQSESTSSEAMLQNWPVQLELAPVKASYFDEADLLIAADCTSYAYANFHQDFIQGRITLIGCPKLDDSNYYAEKLAEILKSNHINSITVVRMEVPCCSGLVQAVKKAMLMSEEIVPYNEATISLAGEIK